MAHSSTIFKENRQISDMDRNYYAEHLLTLARHPSETDERMMVRLLAFALHADEQLSFTKGLSTDEEPDLWQMSLTNEIALWIEVGLPDDRRLAKEAILYSYGGRRADLWWQRNRDQLQRFDNLSVVELPEVACKAITGLVQRNMQLQCTVQDGEIWLTNGESTCGVTLRLVLISSTSPLLT